MIDTFLSGFVIVLILGAVFWTCVGVYYFVRMLVKTYKRPTA